MNSTDFSWMEEDMFDLFAGDKNSTNSTGSGMFETEDKFRNCAS